MKPFNPEKYVNQNLSKEEVIELKVKIILMGESIWHIWWGFEWDHWSSRIEGCFWRIGIQYALTDDLLSFGGNRSW